MNYDEGCAKEAVSEPQICGQCEKFARENAELRKLLELTNILREKEAVAQDGELRHEVMTIRRELSQIQDALLAFNVKLTQAL